MFSSSPCGAIASSLVRATFRRLQAAPTRRGLFFSGAELTGRFRRPRGATFARLPVVPRAHPWPVLIRETLRVELRSQFRVRAPFRGLSARALARVSATTRVVRRS